MGAKEKEKETCLRGQISNLFAVQWVSLRCGQWSVKDIDGVMTKSKKHIVKSPRAFYSTDAKKFKFGNLVRFECTREHLWVEEHNKNKSKQRFKQPSRFVINGD
jgi:hypothetical protein